MREFLHITHKKNLNSVLTHGLLPNRIDLDHHWETFERHGLKERKCVYMWDAETYENTRFVRDMVYTKFYIHPRNNMYNFTDEIDFKKFGRELKGEDCTFYMFKISNLFDEFGGWQHVQEPDDNQYSTTTIMDDKYAHDDKMTHISAGVIPPENIELIEEVRVRVYKERSLGFSFSKIR